MKKYIKNFLRSLGYDISKVTANLGDGYQLLKCFEVVEIDLVFDIGANKGQFSKMLREVGYKGRIVSFEPLSDAHLELREQAEMDEKWSVHERVAIGERSANVEINVSGNSVASSLLPMHELLKTTALGSAYISKEIVPMISLDSISGQYVNGTSKYFIKIDTQGYEWQVLDGAEETLSEAKGVLCELTLVPLYQGQKLWLDIIGRLESSGFVLWAVQSGFKDQDTGRSLQVDAIFLRR